MESKPFFCGSDHNVLEIMIRKCFPSHLQQGHVSKKGDSILVFVFFSAWMFDVVLVGW